MYFPVIWFANTSFTCEYGIIYKNIYFIYSFSICGMPIIPAMCFFVCYFPFHCISIALSCVWMAVEEQTNRKLFTGKYFSFYPVKSVIIYFSLFWELLYKSNHLPVQPQSFFFTHLLFTQLPVFPTSTFSRPHVFSLSTHSSSSQAFPSHL